MQFQIKRDTLLKSLSIAHNIIERKNTIPILANVLLETNRFDAPCPVNKIKLIRLITEKRLSSLILSLSTR